MIEQQAPEILRHIVTFHPAYDKRNEESSKDYGIRAVMIRFIVKGEAGAVQFLMDTDWYPLHVRDEMRGLERLDMPYPHGWDVGYHSPKPQYKGQKRMKCEYTKSGWCYYDGSTMNAERFVKLLIDEGDVGVWRELEKFYNEVFK